MRTNITVVLVVIIVGLICCLSGIPAGIAGEVNKGGIPAAHLEGSCKQLPWGVPVWDTQEAAAHLKSDEKILWVDTRPAALFNKGTVRNAILLSYDKSGEPGNELTKESLESALSTAGMSKADAKIAFFCQGPECHRSYNATFVATDKWGFAPENIIWFRSGYPILLQEIRSDPKMKRKAKLFISDTGMENL